MPGHWQALFFEVLDPDYVPLDYMTHCTHRVDKLPKHRLKNSIINVGYLDKDDRDSTYEVYKRAGKIDAHTVCLVKEPKLETLEWQ